MTMAAFVAATRRSARLADRARSRRSEGGGAWDGCC